MGHDSKHKLRVFVLNGLHQGASIGIQNSAVSIGGVRTCDAVLSDSSASEAHVSVLVDDADRIQATSHGGKIRVGNAYLKSGAAKTVRRGVSVHIGNVQLAFGTSLEDAKHGILSRTRSFTMMRCGAVAAASVGIFMLAMYGGGSIADTARISMPETVRTPVRPVSLTASDEIMMELENRIAGAGLSGLLRVDQPEVNARLDVRGVLTDSQAMRWARIAEWFDGRYGGRMILQSFISKRDDRVVLPFDIVSIIGGEQPRVVLDTGRGYGIGDVLPGGWSLNAVDGMTLKIERGDRMLSIPF